VRGTSALGVPTTQPRRVPCSAAALGDPPLPRLHQHWKPHSPLRFDFENYALVINGAEPRRALEIAGGIADQACLWPHTIHSALEAVQDRDIAALAELEHNPASAALIVVVVAAEIPASLGCAVEIPCRVLNQARPGATAIRLAVELVKNFVGLSLCGERYQSRSQRQKAATIRKAVYEIRAKRGSAQWHD
jgi:hypothetical protein